MNDKEEKKSKFFEHLLKGLSVNFDPEKMSFSVDLGLNKKEDKKKEKKVDNKRPPSFEEEITVTEDIQDEKGHGILQKHTEKPPTFSDRDKGPEEIEFIGADLDDLDHETDPVRIKIHLKAYIKMTLHALKYANENIPQPDWVEVIGLLTGRIESRDTPLTRLVITDAYPIGHGTNVNAWIRDPQSHVKVYNKLKDGMILGWYHSHPGYSPFMSDTDYATQLRYQKLSKRDSVHEAPVAIVIDHTEISRSSYGMKAFRLKKDYRTWEEPKYEVLNCPLGTLPELLQVLLPLTEGKGIFLEYDHE